MTPKAHASNPLTREKPPTIYPPVPFPPPSHKTKWWRGKDSNLRRRKPADLQSAPVGRLGTPPGKNEPRILVSTPRSVNGIGAYFAVDRRTLSSPSLAGPPGQPGGAHIYIGDYLGIKAQPGPRLRNPGAGRAECPSPDRPGPRVWRIPWSVLPPPDRSW
jgi:hypothetical protein